MVVFFVKIVCIDSRVQQYSICSFLLPPPPPPPLDKKRVAVKSFYCNIEGPKIQDKNATIVVQTPRSIYSKWRYR